MSRTFNSRPALAIFLIFTGIFIAAKYRYLVLLHEANIFARQREYAPGQLGLTPLAVTGLEFVADIQTKFNVHVPQSGIVQVYAYTAADRGGVSALPVVEGHVETVTDSRWLPLRAFYTSDRMIVHSIRIPRSDLKSLPDQLSVRIGDETVQTYFDPAGADTTLHTPTYSSYWSRIHEVPGLSDTVRSHKIPDPATWTWAGLVLSKNVRNKVLSAHVDPPPQLQRTVLLPDGSSLIYAAWMFKPPRKNFFHARCRDGTTVHALLHAAKYPYKLPQKVRMELLNKWITYR